MLQNSSRVDFRTPKTIPELTLEAHLVYRMTIHDKIRITLHGSKKMENE